MANPTVSRLFGFNRSPLDPTHRHCTSWAFPPLVLALLRLLISLYAFTTLFTIIALNIRNGHPEYVGQSFSYFTVLNYWSMAFYMLVSGTHGLVYWKRGSSWLGSGQWGRGLQWLHEVWWSCIVTMPWLVTVVFWVILASPTVFAERQSAWQNISEHALNSAFALFEIVFSRMEPRPIGHLLPISLILSLYLGLAYITHATEGFYTYGFLDPKKGTALLIGYIIGILVAACTIFATVCGIIWIRMWLSEKVCGNPGKFAKKDVVSRSQRSGGKEMDDEFEMINDEREGRRW